MEGTDRWTPVVLMLFFILSGAELNVRMFGENPWLIICIVLYVVFRCVGKYFGTMLGAAVTKSDKNVRNYLGITLFPQAGVAIGMATMCKTEFAKAAQNALLNGNEALSGELASVGANIVTITMCAVLIYELVGPVLTKWALGKAGEIAPEFLHRRRNKKAVADGVTVDNAESIPETTVQTTVDSDTASNSTKDTTSENEQ